MNKQTKSRFILSWKAAKSFNKNYLMPEEPKPFCPLSVARMWPMTRNVTGVACLKTDCATLSPCCT